MYCIATCNVCVYLPFNNGTLIATYYLVYFKLSFYHCHFMFLIASANSVIVLCLNLLSFVLSPWRWSLKWPKHVWGYCMRQRFYFSVHFVGILTPCSLVRLVPCSEHATFAFITEVKPWIDRQKYSGTFSPIYQTARYHNPDHSTVHTFYSYIGSRDGAVSTVSRLRARWYGIDSRYG